MDYAFGTDLTPRAKICGKLHEYSYISILTIHDEATKALIR